MEQASTQERLTSARESQFNPLKAAAVVQTLVPMVDVRAAAIQQLVAEHIQIDSVIAQKHMSAVQTLKLYLMLRRLVNVNSLYFMSVLLICKSFNKVLVVNQFDCLLTVSLTLMSFLITLISFLILIPRPDCVLMGDI